MRTGIRPIHGIQIADSRRLPTSATPSAGVSVKVIAGRFGVAIGPVLQTATDPSYLDVTLAARPLRESIACCGPFVRNTPAQIAQAMDDFRQGRF